MDVIMKADVAGVGEWRIGYETNDVWLVINASLKNTQAQGQ